MVFRFICVECSAVEVACLAQNIRHCSGSVQLHLVVLGVSRAGVTNVVPAGTRSPARTMWVARELVLKITKRS